MHEIWKQFAIKLLILLLFTFTCIYLVAVSTRRDNPVGFINFDIVY